MRILGIDPGSAATGFGVVERVGGQLVHVASGTVRPPRGAPLAERLRFVQHAIAEVVAEHRPDAVSVEQVFVAASPRAALILGQARGAALVGVAEGGVAVSEYAAAQIKRAVTGNGRAPKGQVQHMVRRLLGLECSLASDASDALAAAICHAQSLYQGGLGGSRRRRVPRRGSALRVRPRP